jgi:ribosome-associated protein
VPTDPEREHLTEPPSKSSRKREAARVRDLAKILIEKRAADDPRFPLDDQVRSELRAAAAIRSNVARKRQLQYVAKLLRRADTAPIFAAIEAVEDQARQGVARQHRVEAWRDLLIDAGDPALTRLVEARDDVDVPALRNLMRNAERERRQGRPPAAQRALFRLLRALDESATLPPA